ncbi:hypothetical protein PUN28_001955 [Cardiocondyla obscurior]
MTVKNTIESQPMPIESILTRDQRTTSHRVHDHAMRVNALLSEPPTTISSSPQIKYQDDTVARRHYRHVKTITAKTLKREKKSDLHLIPTFYHNRRTRRSNASFRILKSLRLSSALVILLVLSAHTAPVMNSSNKTNDMKWVNPCGVSTNLRTNGSNPDIAQLEDHDLLIQIVLQAETALRHAKHFRDDFIRQTFKTNFVSVHNLWKKNHYAWLSTRSEIPKELGEELNKEYLDKLDINTSLVDTYEYMQKCAVGLEQIVLDQKDYQPIYYQKFMEAEWKLRAVLCEIQVALGERSVVPRPDVTRDVMPPDFRTTTDMTFRDLRDWLIFREYMNGLEYVIQVFSHLRQRL